MQCAQLDLRRILRRSSSAVATSREGRRSRARSLGTPQQLALHLFQGAPRPHRDCRSLRQLLKCEHTYNPFPIGGDLKQISIVRRGLLLCEHALACPLNLKAIDDALQNGCSRRGRYHLSRNMR